MVDSPKDSASPTPFWSPTPVWRENIVGIGMAEKYSRGEPTGQWGVTFFVNRKFPLSLIGPEDRLPERVGSGEWPTDVVETGPFQTFANAEYAQSINRGDQQGQKVLSPPGTLGAFVKSRNPDDQAAYLLTAGHVVENVGISVWQPPGFATQPNPDIIAWVNNVVYRRIHGVTIDAATARLEPTATTVIGAGLRHPSGAEDCLSGLVVEKWGAATQHTTGRIDVPSATFKTDKSSGPVRVYERHVGIGLHNATQVFGLPGDSGAVVLRQGTTEAVALVVAGSTGRNRVTIATPIKAVLDSLDCDF
ncbi:S1 family peptidase [Zavarzinella formosa]|uniref:S1 family peptidase n=1 Tax=Zavarzinella formosa TaxID=360055 RepID=UPI001EE68CEB|nr:S1 family peptidase [Zavarzinella formosa]